MHKLIRITTIPGSLKTLLKEQLKYMSNYYEVIAVSSDGECFNEMLHEQGDIRGVKIEMTRKITPLKDFIALIKLIILFRKEKPMIVHTHTPKAGLLGMMAAYITRVPFRLHTIAGLPLTVANGNKKRILALTEKLTSFCATNIYPNSFVQGDYMKANKLVKPNKVKVIGNGSSNGIDTNFFDPSKIIISKDPKVFTFIFVGRIVPDKGINELCEAFRKLLVEYQNVKLLIVGNFETELYPLEPRNIDYILNSENINYVGFQSDVRPFLGQANALVFPSYREGFPNVVMQAGAMGLPSIVTDINGCNEIIKDGVNGIIIPSHNADSLCGAMKYFIDNKDDDVVKMASRARGMIVSRYDRNIVWNALLKEYKSLEQNV